MRHARPGTTARGAAAQWPPLVDAVAGREIVTIRAGKLARPGRQASRPRRVLGSMAGCLRRVPADFDAPLPAKILDGFEGR